MKILGLSGYDFSRVFADGRFDLPETYRLAASQVFYLGHDHEQILAILGYFGQYGETLAGLGRLLKKLPIHGVFRRGRTDEGDEHGKPETLDAFLPSNMVMGL